MTPYDEGLEQRRKWKHGAIAELLGYEAAKMEPSPRMMSEDAYLQQRYDQGFADGKAILATSGVTA